MKVAVLFRGPLRPTAAHTRVHIADFMTHFVPLGIKPVRFLGTWHLREKTRDAQDLLERDVDNVVALSMPSESLIGASIHDALLPSLHRARNIFYQHYVAKAALQCILNHDDYDLIVHTRTDMSIDFGNQFESWFAPDRLELYQALHVRDIFPGSFLNDQFSIARPHLMYDAWNYGSFERLRKRIENVITIGGKAEDVLQSILDDAGITAIGSPVRSFSLDADRHKVS